MEKIDQIIEGDFIIEENTETFEDTYYYASEVCQLSIKLVDKSLSHYQEL